MDWKTMLNYIAGFVDEELLLRNEYLVAENRVLRNQTQGRLRLTDGERRSLAELGKSLQRPVTSSPSAKVHSCERLGGCSVSTIGKPHEYFDLTGLRPAPDSRPRRAYRHLSYSLLDNDWTHPASDHCRTAAHGGRARRRG